MDAENNPSEIPRVLFSAHGRWYRLFSPLHATACCFLRVVFPTIEAYQTFLTHQFTRDPYWREILRREALYYGVWSMVSAPEASLAAALHTGHLHLVQVVPSGSPRGEMQPPEEKKPWRAVASAGADLLPVVGSAKSALQAVTGTDLGTGEAVSRWGEAVGVVASLIPGGKLLAKIGGKKISEKLGENGLKQAQTKLEHTPDARFNKRYHGPDAMTRDKNGKLAEWEAKGTKDGNARVAKDQSGYKQGSRKKNAIYAEKMLTKKKKKVGKPTNRIGGPYTAAEMDLWREVQRKKGQKQHISTHTNTETGQVRVLERDSKGNIVKQVDEFKLDDFEATKQKLIEEHPK